jgi:hypothetical protein
MVRPYIGQSSSLFAASRLQEAKVEAAANRAQAVRWRLNIGDSPDSGLQVYRMHPCDCDLLIAMPITRRSLLFKRTKANQVERYTPIP